MDKTGFSALISLLFLGLCLPLAAQTFMPAEASSEKPAPATLYSGRVTTTGNAVYTLKNFTISRLEYFNCRLRDSVFKIPFEKVQSLTLTPTPEPLYAGYTQGSVTWVGGGQVQVYVSTANYRVEGLDEKLGVSLKIPLSEIVTIQLIQEKQPGAKTPVTTQVTPGSTSVPATSPTPPTQPDTSTMY